MAYKSQVTIGTGATSGDTTASPTFSFNHTCENFSNCVVIVGVGARHTTTSNNTIAASATYGGVAMNRIDFLTIGGGGATAIGVTVFLLQNPPVGLNTVSVTMNANPSQVTGAACAFGNVDQNTPQDFTDVAVNATSATAETDGFNSTDDRTLGVTTHIVNNTNALTITRPSPSSNPGSTPTTIEAVVGSATSYILCAGTSDILPNREIITQITNGGANKLVIITLYLRPIRRRSHAT